MFRMLIIKIDSIKKIQSNPIANIRELIYGFTKLERNFGSVDFGNDKLKSWISTVRHLLLKMLEISIEQ